MAQTGDGYQTFVGGMNEGVSATLIGELQTHRNINITLRTKAVRPRPAVREVELTFLTKKVADQSPLVGSLTYEEIFLFGRQQHSGKFQTDTGEFYITVRDGIIFAVDMKRQEIRVVPVTPFTNRLLNYNATRIVGCQADKYYVLADYPNNPVYIDFQFEAKRTKDSREEIPRCHVVTFNHNRLFVGEGIEFGASDPVSPDNRLAPITFKESIVSEANPSPAYPDQFFRLNYIDRLSPITAMGYLKSTNGTSRLGYGPLFISTKEAIHLFGVDQPREQWGTSPFGSAYIFNYGIIGPRAFVNVGPDLFYKAYDGFIYSTGTLFSDQREWGNTNISHEIAESLHTRNKRILPYSTLGYFNNRVFASLRPFITKARGLFGLPIEDYVSNGFAALENANASGLSGKNPPVWASIHSGLVCDFLEIDNKFFIFGKTIDGKRNIILTHDVDRTTDIYAGQASKVRSRIITRTLMFKSEINDKQMQYINTQVQDILGEFSMRVYYRFSDADPDWKYFGGIDYCAPKYRRGRIDGETISRVGNEDSTFKSVQFRIDIEGDDWELTNFILISDFKELFAPQRKYEMLTESCGANFGKVEDYQL